MATTISRVAKVENKAPEIQITAEQSFREAEKRDSELMPPPPKRLKPDPEELAKYQLGKRQAFEYKIRRHKMLLINHLITYAKFEENQRDIKRARSVYERALVEDERNLNLWLHYAEMEIKHRQVSNAQNIFDRAISIFPRVNQLWYRYTYMEEMLRNSARARQVFERWMEWQPDEQAWLAYIKFELRFLEIDRARQIFERFVIVHPTVQNWIRYAHFEEKNGYKYQARSVYERAVKFCGKEGADEMLYIAYAKFEENQNEHNSARMIYKYALDNIPKEKVKDLLKHCTIYEQKCGDGTIEDCEINCTKTNQYEKELRNNPLNYDCWFDYLRLMESEGDLESTREVYERAITNVPLKKDKKYWKRYIYLWIKYALFEELQVQGVEVDRTREVYQGCLRVIPHRNFTFAKIWLLAAQYEIRQKNLAGARSILDAGIGMCPKNKLFHVYINLEIQLQDFERCRALYLKFIEFSPENSTTWIKFAELETVLLEFERARAIYKIAFNQPMLDRPEIVWKAYINFRLNKSNCVQSNDSTTDALSDKFDFCL